jgi:putative acetyltransferase
VLESARIAGRRPPAREALVEDSSGMQIVRGDFEDEQVQALIRAHLAGMHASSPPGTVYALDLSGLRSPQVSFFAAWEGSTVVGIGALKERGEDAGEIKSMRTHAAHLRRGVAARMLEHLLSLARSRGYRRVSLETGTGPEFAAADSLYRRYGFANGECFGEYAPSEFNQFMHLDL